ncbi:MAG: type II secretion system protein [Planctomycetota bacterium]|nr:type II secretion system protein [Planctomycetota bacterium]
MKTRRHNCLARSRAPGNARAGFTLMEAMIATVIVGVMLTAVLTTLGASKTSRSITADRAVG